MLSYRTIESARMTRIVEDDNRKMSEISKEAVAGVWPTDFGGATITAVWPSIAATAVGRLLGTIYSLPRPLGLIIGMLTMPVPVVVGLMYLVGSRLKHYSLSTVRVRVCRGFSDKKSPEVLLTDLEDVRFVERPGQAFYRAGDLELICGGKVELTLEGVTNPETFRHNILAARQALLSVTACQRDQEAAAAS